MQYRLYGMDGPQHIVVSLRELMVRDDLAALKEAETLCEAQIVEIWQGSRYVARVKKGNAPLNASDRMSL